MDVTLVGGARGFQTQIGIASATLHKLSGINLMVGVCATGTKETELPFIEIGGYIEAKGLQSIEMFVFTEIVRRREQEKRLQEARVTREAERKRKLELEDDLSD